MPAMELLLQLMTRLQEPIRAVPDAEVREEVNLRIRPIHHRSRPIMVQRLLRREAVELSDLVQITLPYELSLAALRPQAEFTQTDIGKHEMSMGMQSILVPGKSPPTI